MKLDSKVLLYATVVCLVLGGATAVLGQSTTGSLSGVVTAKEDEAALPGAQITAVHQPTGTRYNGISGVDGRFRILNVRVGGPYTVSAAMDGFHTQEATDVFVQLGEDASLRFQLQLASIDETLIVVAESSPLINPSKTGASSNVSTEAIETLPTVQRSLYDFARTNPFFTVGNENEDPDAISVAGRSGRYNNITIDGSVNNDIFGLADSATPGGQAGTTPISLDAIQELELVLADFDVRNGGFSGGAINAITRSGSNDFEGSVFFYTRDNDYFGDGNDEVAELGEFSEDQYGFRLGGPISKDKVFFFVNADLEERTTPTGVSIDGATGQQVGLTRDGTFFDAVEQANRFRQILIDNYGFDPGGLSENGRDNPSDKILAKLDFNLNDSNNLTLRHNYVDAGLDVNRPGTTFYEFPSETYDFQSETNSTVGQINSVFGTNYFNEARIALQSIKDRRAGRDGVRFPHIQTDVEIPFGNGQSGTVVFEAGTENFSTNNALDTEILEIHNDFTLLKGDHTITIGTHNEIFNFQNLFIQDGFGSYDFGSLDDLEAGIAQAYFHTFANPGQNPVQDFDVNQIGLYIGDQWTVRPTLTLNYGLRVDIPFFPDSPDRNPLTEELYNFRTDEVPDGEQLWSPRFGFNWDIEGNGESQLRGGAGIFSGRTPYVWISNVYARNALVFTSLSAFGNIPFVADPDNPPRADDLPGGRTAVGEFNLIDPSFKFPQVLRYNLAYDRQLPWWGLIFSAEVVFSDSIEEIDYFDANRRQTGSLTFDGRPMYTAVDPRIDGAYVITNTGDGEATNFSLKLERPYRNGFWGYVSYAFNEAKVVNEGSSSRAVSNYRFNEAIDPNNAGLTTSDFEVEHRFNASLSYRFNNDSNYSTTLSFFYNLQSGRPFSWLMGSDSGGGTGFFGDSYNGDGWDNNDLAYVPAAEGDVVITNRTWEELDAFISANPVLDANRGRIVPRNADEAPWNHSLDLHIAQDIPIKNTRLQVTLDILNLLNLIDEDSGVLHFAPFNSQEVWEVEGICGDPNFTEPESNSCVPGVDDGKPAISLRGPATGGNLFDVHNEKSRWRAKVGIRWSF